MEWNTVNVYPHRILLVIAVCLIQRDSHTPSIFSQFSDLPPWCSLSLSISIIEGIMCALFTTYMRIYPFVRPLNNHQFPLSRRLCVLGPRSSPFTTVSNHRSRLCWNSRAVYLGGKFEGLFLPDHSLSSHTMQNSVVRVHSFVLVSFHSGASVSHWRSNKWW